MELLAEAAVTPTGAHGLALCEKAAHEVGDLLDVAVVQDGHHGHVLLAQARTAPGVAETQAEVHVGVWLDVQDDGHLNIFGRLAVLEDKRALCVLFADTSRP
jgi:hypothetical protein